MKIPDWRAWLHSILPAPPPHPPPPPPLPWALRLTRSTRISCESLWKAQVISRHDISRNTAGPLALPLALVLAPPPPPPLALALALLLLRCRLRCGCRLYWRKKSRYWAPCSSMDRRCLLTWATDSTMAARLICSGPVMCGMDTLVSSPPSFSARASSKLARSSSPPSPSPACCEAV